MISHHGNCLPGCAPTGCKWCCSTPRWATGATGTAAFAAVPGREEEFRASLALVIDYADALQCDIVHVTAGVVGQGDSYAAAQRTYVANL